MKDKKDQFNRENVNLMGKTAKIIVHGNYINHIDEYTEIHHVDHYYNCAKEEAKTGPRTEEAGEVLALPADAPADIPAAIGPGDTMGLELRQIAAALAPFDPQGITAQVFEQVFLEPQAQPQRQQLQEYARESLKTTRRTTYRMGDIALSPVVRIIGRLHQLGVYGADTDRLALVRRIPSGSYPAEPFYRVMNAYARRGASDTTPRKQSEIDLLKWVSETAAEVRPFGKVQKFKSSKV